MINYDRAYFEDLAQPAFSAINPGYKPDVIEAPNGDGHLDTKKRYAHIAPKYFHAHTPAILRDAYHNALCEAQAWAMRLGLPMPLWPSYNDCALRLLEYPAGAGGHIHTDFDLFTVNLWRSDPSAMQQAEWSPRGVHFGELWHALGLGCSWSARLPTATAHWIEPRTYAQQSLVFFALPSPDVRLPTGGTVRDWLAERIARSRHVRT